MGDFSIYSLNNINSLTYEEIKEQYKNVFNTTLMIMGYTDYTDVLNHKYGTTEIYTLKTDYLVSQFIEMLNYENVGIILLDTTKLNELIISFGVTIDVNMTPYEQASSLIKNMLIDWYDQNNSTFQYPISGEEYIDKNSEDMIYIIQSSYIVVYI
jgi:hypothetical protein